MPETISLPTREPTKAQGDWVPPLTQSGPKRRSSGPKFTLFTWSQFLHTSSISQLYHLLPRELLSVSSSQTLAVLQGLAQMWPPPGSLLRFLIRLSLSSPGNLPLSFPHDVGSPWSWEEGKIVF